MLTDTANFRNPNYHTPNDTPDTLDLGFARLVTQATLATIVLEVGCACPADLDANGSVGVKDLLFLLGVWGPCPKQGDCPADFDLSGDVGVKDLLILLGNWGPCP